MARLTVLYSLVSERSGIRPVLHNAVYDLLGLLPPLLRRADLRALVVPVFLPQARPRRPRALHLRHGPTQPRVLSNVLPLRIPQSIPTRQLHRWREIFHALCCITVYRLYCKYISFSNTKSKA